MSSEAPAVESPVEAPVTGADAPRAVVLPTATSPNGLLRAFPALGSPRFRRFWLGMLLQPLAWQMYLVASGFIAFTLSGSATVLGLVSLSVGGPMFLFALVGGVVADRLPRIG